MDNLYLSESLKMFFLDSKIYMRMFVNRVALEYDIIKSQITIQDFKHTFQANRQKYNLAQFTNQMHSMF